MVDEQQKSHGDDGGDVTIEEESLILLLSADDERVGVSSLADNVQPQSVTDNGGSSVVFTSGRGIRGRLILESMLLALDELAEEVRLIAAVNLNVRPRGTLCCGGSLSTNRENMCVSLQ